jgi:SAM-dependent methyltransferase
LSFPSVDSLAAMMQPVDGCARGVVAPNVALTQLFMAAPNEDAARQVLLSAIEASACAPEEAGVSRLFAMQTLWDGAPQAYPAISAIHDLAKGELQGSQESRIGQIASLFDRAAAISPAAGIALYSLGEAQLLDASTHEIVALMRAWNLFGLQSRVADVGCGTGRFLAALAPCVHSIVGIDISQAMLDAARSRVAGFANAFVVRGSGRDLSALGSGPFDLVLAVDSFPYLIQAGVAETHAGDCAGMLAPGGHLLIMNYSYRGDLDADRAELAQLAAKFGFTVLRNGTRDLQLWDGAAFVLEKPA